MFKIHVCANSSCTRQYFKGSEGWMMKRQVLVSHCAVTLVCWHLVRVLEHYPPDSRITIITPCYQKGKYLERFIRVLVKKKTKFHITKTTLICHPLFFFLLNGKLIIIWIWVVILLSCTQLLIHKITATYALFYCVNLYCHFQDHCLPVSYVFFCTISSLQHISEDVVVTHSVSRMKAVEVCTAYCCVSFYHLK